MATEEDLSKIIALAHRGSRGPTTERDHTQAELTALLLTHGAAMAKELLELRALVYRGVRPEEYSPVTEV